MVSPGSKALYYPWIDVNPNSLIKSYVLYWDQIYTLVPEDLEQPYMNDTSRFLAERGWLVPLRVSAESAAVRTAEKTFMRLLVQNETILDTLADPNFVDHEFQHPLGWQLDGHIAVVGGKSSERLRMRIHNLARARSGPGGQLSFSYAYRPTLSPWPSSLAVLYLTTLCTELARANGMALLPAQAELMPWVEASYTKLLSRNFRLGQRVIERSKYGFGGAVAGLVQLSMSTVAFDERTPIEKVVRFREKHQVELAHYRTQVNNLASRLTSGHPGIRSQAELDEVLHDSLINEIMPAINELRIARRAARISAGPDILKTIGFSISPGLLAALAGHPLLSEVVSASGVLASAAVSIAKLQSDSKIASAGKPFSFVLAAQDKFGSRMPSRSSI